MSDKIKGVGVFPRKESQVEALIWNGSFQLNGLQTTSPMATWSTKELKLFLHFRLNDQYTTLACWAKARCDQVFGYRGQFWKYLLIHREDLHQENTLIVGDFNSNSQWDKQVRWWNHSDTVNVLSMTNL